MTEKITFEVQWERWHDPGGQEPNGAGCAVLSSWQPSEVTGAYVMQGGPNDPLPVSLDDILERAADAAPVEDVNDWRIHARIDPSGWVVQVLIDGWTGRVKDGYDRD
jgi:hypothetical protein